MLLLPIAYTDKLAARFKQSAVAVHLPKIRRDIATGTSLIQLGTVNPYTGRHGVGSIAPAASQAHGLYSLYPSNIGTADVTTIAHIQVVQTLSGNEYVCGHYAAGVLVLAIQLNATGKIGVFVGANSGSNTTINTNITPVIGESYCVAHRQVNGLHSIFVNGVKTNEVSLGYNGNSGGSFTSNNINYTTANTNSSRQLVYYAGKFKDVFTDAELLELTRDPQQIFEQEQQLFYFNATTSSVTVNIDWTDENDSLASGLNASQTIALSWTDSNDVISIVGNITTPATCDISWTDANDTVSITGTVITPAIAGISWADPDDSISIVVDIEQPITCGLYWFDDNDTFQFTATSDGIAPIVNLVWGGVPQQVKPRKLKARKAKKQVEAIVDDVIDTMIANAETSEKQRFKAAIDEVIVKNAIKKSMAEARKVVRQQLQKQLDDEDEEDVIFLLTHA